MRSCVREFDSFGRLLKVGLVLNLELVLTFWYLIFENNSKFYK